MLSINSDISFFEKESSVYTLAFTFLLYAFSILLFVNQRRNASIVILIISSLFAGYFVATLDPFLCLWDEQYHALVAKHMLDNPFVPKLYDNPILSYDYRNWISNNIWLHKQPLFIWQIALSLKLFGINELSVRIPSIIMHSITTWFVYKLGSRMAKQQTGYYAAILFSASYYLLELSAGKYSTDHNDVAILFYLTGSLYAWVEYESTQKSKWIFLIGIFAGCAVLVKWLIGLMVYGIWGVTILITNRNKVELINLLKSFCVALIIFIPWQIYIRLVFPIESSFESQAAFEHLFHSIEDHKGDLFYHFKLIPILYRSFSFVPVLLGVGIILLFIQTQKNYRIAFISCFLIIYGLFSFASTKMMSFTILFFPFGFISLGFLIENGEALMRKYVKNNAFIKSILFMVILLLTYKFMSIPQLIRYHTFQVPMDNCNRINDINQMKLIDQINHELGNKQHVIFDADTRLQGQISVMFYTLHIAYEQVPTKEEILQVKNHQLPIAIVVREPLPEYISSDTSIYKLYLK